MVTPLAKMSSHETQDFGSAMMSTIPGFKETDATSSVGPGKLESERFASPMTRQGSFPTVCTLQAII